MMKACVVAGLLAVLCGRVAGAEEKPAPAEPFLEKQTGISFPQVVGDLRRESVKEYPDAKLGVTIPYKADSVHSVNFYVYDLGLKKIPSDAESDVVREQADDALNAARQFAKQNGFKDLRVDGRDIVPLTADEKGLKAQHLALSFSIGRDRYLSHIYVAGCRDHFVKLRYTYKAESAREAETQRDLLLKWLGGAIVEKAAVGRKK